jgi:hypothetical protein
MSIFIDQNDRSAEAFADCLTISISDGNLGDQPVTGDPSIVELTYDGAAPPPATAARLHALVHNNFGGTIVISGIVVTALNGGIDPYSLLDVTGNGFTYIDMNVTPNVIRVVYDISSCNGQGIHVFDVDGNEISLPRPPLIYHELSHAFRAATNSQLSNDEPPAETDENVMRSALGYCLRDVNNHGGGCGHGDDCSGPPTPDDGGCFIVSATTGSVRSIEVQHLRALRDRVSARSGLAARLIDAVYAEYYTFSPAIASMLHQSPLARHAVYALVVRPLLAWYDLAGVLGFESADRRAVATAASQLSHACPIYLGRGWISSLVERIDAGNAAPERVPRLLRGYASRIEAVARLPFASWAILDALASAWRPSTHRDPAAAVAQWSARAPIDTLPLSTDVAAFDAELAALARLLDFDPEARRLVGERLARLRPDAAAALARHGFAPTGGRV